MSAIEKLDFCNISNRGFNKLSNDTTFIKIEVILLKIQFVQNVNCELPFILFIFYTLFCSLSQNKPGFCCTGSQMSLLVVRGIRFCDNKKTPDHVKGDDQNYFWMQKCMYYLVASGMVSPFMFDCSVIIRSHLGTKMANYSGSSKFHIGFQLSGHRLQW